MNETLVWRLARGLGACALALCAATAGAAGAAPSQPGAGYADPHGLPARAAVRDVKPVLRAPAVDTLATIRKRGTLRVAVVPVEPMVMRDKRGELVGFSIDLARRLAVDIGVQVEFVPTSWAEVIPDLLHRRADLVATGLWVTVPRALVVNFSKTTAAEGIYLVAGKDKAAALRTLEDYNQPGVTIAAYAGTPQEALAQKLFPRATLLRAEDDDLATVLDGRAHAVLLPTLSSKAVLAGAPDKLFLARELPLSVTPAALAVRKGDPDFLNFLDTWIGLRQDDGWLEDRAVYWATATDWMK